FTTGGSIVEDAEDTNSPISSSLVSASRDVIPSCLATSWTRSFATILLFWLNRGLHYLVHNRDSCRSNVCSVNDAHKAANRLAHAPCADFDTHRWALIVRSPGIHQFSDPLSSLFCVLVFSDCHCAKLSASFSVST